jgi:hypothetical protein
MWQARERRKMDRGLMWKPEGKRKTGRPRRRWDAIKEIRK